MRFIANGVRSRIFNTHLPGKTAIKQLRRKTAQKSVINQRSEEENGNGLDKL